MDLNVIIEKLNDDQVKPVLDTEGAVLVIAGAGSGKTRVLTSRIAYLMLQKGVLPEQIMAITFTNKAAKEMRERLSTLVGDVGDMWVSTIHSMCVRILRRDIDKLGYDKNFSIYDETDKDKTLKRVLEDLGIDADKMLKNAKYHISNAKNECLTPAQYKEQNLDVRFIDDICAIYDAYENQMARSNALDFDDLLFKTYELFAKHQEVADYYSNKFRYIHIDEFQDTNTVQFAIAKRLSLVHGNIFAVGDDDQSIYGWRGAKIENILTFDTIFSGAKVYKLEQNYRSTKKILQLANCIIANNTGRREKELWTENGDGVKVESFVGTDENNEAAYVAMQIKNLMARSCYKFSDFAIFMRVNAISRALEQELTKYAIPYKVFGGFKFFERKEIKDVLSYLKLVVNSSDDESFLRSIAIPKRGIGEKTLRDLREFSVGKGVSMLDAIDSIDESSISVSTKTKLKNYKQIIDKFKDYSITHNASDLIKFVLETTEFTEQFSEKTEENYARLLNIDELKNSAEQFHQDNPNSTIADYLNSVSLSSDTDAINSDDCVTLATIHAAKGLEYKCVFVTGLDEEILPIARSFNSEEDMEEERRLMYVAVTRAMERLYLTRAMSRYLYGQRKYMTQSRFLKEARPVLYSTIDEKKTADYSFSSAKYDKYDDEISPTTRNGGYSSNYAKTFLQNNKPKVTQNFDFSKYKSGIKVKHAKFGEGTVIVVKGNGDNMIVDVAFKGVGIKSLSAKFAPMEIL